MFGHIFEHHDSYPLPFIPILPILNSKTLQECETALTMTILNSRFIHGHIHGLGLHLGISQGVGHGVGYVLVMSHGVAQLSSVIYRLLTVIYRFLTVIHLFLMVTLRRGRYRAARAAKN